jgi:hypothetical protein
MSQVYHFTDTARLPWIWASGELRPGRNQIGGYPVDFLWATTNQKGDRTASGMQLYRQGETALVRLTLHAEDFAKWSEVLKHSSQWTYEQVNRLCMAALAKGEANIAGWRVRTVALPLSRIVSVEAKTYTGAWQTIDPDTACIRINDDDILAVNLGGTLYASKQTIEPGQPTQYTIQKLLPDEWCLANK